MDLVTENATKFKMARKTSYTVTMIFHINLLGLGYHLSLITIKIRLYRVIYKK